MIFLDEDSLEYVIERKGRKYRLQNVSLDSFLFWREDRLKALPEVYKDANLFYYEREDEKDSSDQDVLSFVVFDVSEERFVSPDFIERAFAYWKMGKPFWLFGRRYIDQFAEYLFENVDGLKVYRPDGTLETFDYEVDLVL